MAVYIISQITIHDRAEYDKYSDQFMGVFQEFNGKVLSADFEPKVWAGEWKADRSVLLEFPDEKSAMAWVTSDGYTKIAKHRDAGATLNSILVQGI